jgi:hypothetical protein
LRIAPEEHQHNVLSDKDNLHPNKNKFEFDAFQINPIYMSLIILEFIFRFAFGYSGNKLIVSRLGKRGYWKGVTVNARNKQSAIEQYKR